MLVVGLLLTPGQDRFNTNAVLAGAWSVMDVFDYPNLLVRMRPECEPHVKGGALDIDNSADGDYVRRRGVGRCKSKADAMA